MTVGPRVRRPDAGAPTPRPNRILRGRDRPGSGQRRRGPGLPYRGLGLPGLREQLVSVVRGFPLVDYAHSIFGDAHDPARGRQMPCHPTARGVHYVSMSSVIGTQISQAVGLAYALRQRRDPGVALAFFGDGATSSNDFHAGLNFAGVFRLPVVFVCANNQWAISVPVERQTAAPTLAAKAAAYGLPGHRFDGTDFIAVYRELNVALRDARSGNGPTMLELLTYRMTPHSSSDDPTRYQPADWVGRAVRHDPVARLERWMTEHDRLPEELRSRIHSEAEEAARSAVRAAEETPPPGPETASEDVYASSPSREGLSGRLRGGTSMAGTYARTTELLVIGGGPGGYMAAIRAGQLGKKVLLVEKGDLGGECLNRGCIPSKALIHASRLYHAIRTEGPEIGVRATDPTFDLVTAMRWKEEVVSKERQGVVTLLKAAGVTVLPGTVRFTGPRSADLTAPDGGHERIDFSSAVIATGAVHSALKGFETDGERVVNAWEILSSKSLPRSMLILGGGVSGCELGEFLARVGVEVTIIELLPQLLPGPRTGPIAGAHAGSGTARSASASRNEGRGSRAPRREARSYG